MTDQTSSPQSQSRSSRFEKFIDTTTKKIVAVTALLVALAAFGAALKPIWEFGLEHIPSQKRNDNATVDIETESICTDLPNSCAVLKDWAENLEQNKGEENQDEQ